MPKNIEIYLYNLEKKVMIEEIWDDNIGYSFLSNRLLVEQYQNMAVIKRLRMHVDERTQ